MALTHADRALAMNGENVPALSSKAWALNTLGRYKEALPIATHASTVDPGFGESYAAISNAQNGLGDHKAALAADNQHVRIHNDETTAYSMRSDTYKALGKTKEAKADADMVAKLEKSEN